MASKSVVGSTNPLGTSSKRSSITAPLKQPTFSPKSLSFPRPTKSPIIKCCGISQTAISAPDANTVAAAEHGIALLCAMARNVPQCDSSMKAGNWDRQLYVGVSLVGKTLAVMGFGKVGFEVAKRAKGLGLHVIAHDPYAPADRASSLGVEMVSFENAISTADFISIHMPLTPTTSKVFNDETFAKMKKGVRIVNVARGGLIDEDALIRALDSGAVAQAALDVFTEEPPSQDNKLVLHRNVIATPHLGASTRESQEGVGIEIAEAVLEALNKGQV